jgi:hypothetical protein
MLDKDKRMMKCGGHDDFGAGILECLRDIERDQRFVLNDKDRPPMKFGAFPNFIDVLFLRHLRSASPAGGIGRCRRARRTSMREGVLGNERRLASGDDATGQRARREQVPRIW